ncbi:MAG: hypothetical protein RL766_1178, partial [Bacteroidota bacterium]
MRRLSCIILFSLLWTPSDAQQLQGAWKRNLDTAIQTLTIVDNYFSVATFHVQDKKFINTSGGTALQENGELKGKIEFNTADRSQVTKNYT